MNALHKPEAVTYRFDHRPDAPGRNALTAAERQLPSLQDARILLVDDDPGAIQHLSQVLAGYAQLRFATGGAQALQLAQQWSPELILLDAEMPGMSGFEVCRALQADPLLASVPVIFITQHVEPQIEMAVFELGAADFIGKPVTGPALRARVAMHLRLQRMARALVQTESQDGLTGLASRTRFDEQLAAEWLRARRSGQALSLLLADLDQFRAYNDRHGGRAGDDCLRRVARLLRTLAQRPGDLAARHGADEFALLLPGTDADGAQLLASRMAHGLREMELPLAPNGANLTVSVGLSLLPARSGPGSAPAWTHAHLRSLAVSALAAARAAGPGAAVLRAMSANPAAGADLHPAAGSA